MPNDSQNRFNNKWLPWKQNKRYLVQLTFSAKFLTFSTSLQNFKSLRVRVLQITGGGRGGSPLKVWVPNISEWEELPLV